MKKLIAILDSAAFIIYGIFFACAILAILAVTALFRGRVYRKGGINRLSFTVADFISNKYSSLAEDALLGGYISKDYYIYVDFNNKSDRFEKIGDGIFFHSIAAHPNSKLYNSGFRNMNALLRETRSLAAAFSIASASKLNFIKSHDPHILGLNGLVIARLFRIPLALHMNSDFGMKYKGVGKTSSPLFMSRSMEKMFESFIMDRSDLIMADREFYKNSPNFHKKNRNKYHAFGVRVDEKHYSDPLARRDMKDALGISGKKVLLYIGRLHPVKYPEDAMKAFVSIRRNYKDAAFLIVGTGILRKSLEAIAAKEGMCGSVLFLGSRTMGELIDIYHTADVVLAPHGGVTLLEAALASTPTVAYDFDWHTEFLEDGRMGYIVPFRDFNAMAEKALGLLKDDTLRKKMGLFCREAAIARYGRGVSIENEKRIYSELIKI